MGYKNQISFRKKNIELMWWVHVKIKNYANSLEWTKIKNKKNVLIR